MDEKRKENTETQTYIEVLKKTQEKMPSLVLPSMGLLENEITVKINGKDYIKRKND